MQVYSSKARYRCVVAGRRFGKSILSKTLMIKFATKPRSKVWYVAPTYRMAKQIMWQDLLDSLPARWIKRVNETTMSIWLVNGSLIELKGADNPDSLRGVGLHFLVLDEFQDMTEETWTRVLLPTMADKNGHALFIGSPKGFNHFYDIYMLGQDKHNVESGEWQSWQFPTIISPFIPRKEIESARRNMDEKSFNQEFLACHLPETEILMWGGGAKQIQHVTEDDLVVHIQDDGQRVPANVIQIGETGHKVIADIVLETGEIVSASAHHKFKVYA